MVFSAGTAYAETRYGDSMYFIKKQTVWLIIGFAVMYITSHIDPSVYKKYTPHFYGATLVLLVLVLIIGFAGNGMAAIVARTQQMDFDGNLRGQFMTMAIAFALVISIIMYVLSDKRDTKAIIKTAGYVPALAGIINVFHNLIVLVLAVSPISPSLVYPVISVGGIIIVALFSFFFMKEKISLIQWIGIALGAAATVLLSI